jgi:hypothetical protein
VVKPEARCSLGLGEGGDGYLQAGERRLIFRFPLSSDAFWIILSHHLLEDIFVVHSASPDAFCVLRLAIGDSLTASGGGCRPEPPIGGSQIQPPQVRQVMMLVHGVSIRVFSLRTLPSCTSVLQFNFLSQIKRKQLRRPRATNAGSNGKLYLPRR